MICPECKNKINEENIYCPHCGFIVQIVPDYNPIEDEFDIHLSKIAVEEEVFDKESEEQKIVVKKKRKKLKFLLSFLFLILCIGIGIGIFSYVRKKENYNSYDYQITMAKEHFKTDDFEQSFLYVERALDLNSKGYEAMILKARLFIAQKNIVQGEIMLKEMVKEFPDNMEAYELLKAIYEDEKKYPELSELGESVKNPEIKKLFEDYLVSSPRFNFPEGIFEEYIDVKLFGPSDETIYYTLDNTAPTNKSTEYENPIELKEGRTVIRAVSANEKGILSKEEKRVYIVRIPIPKVLNIEPGSGAYREPAQIVVEIPENCKAYYTLDGSDPTLESPEYTEPVDMPLGNQIFSVIVVNELGKSGPVERRNYELQLE